MKIRFAVYIALIAILGGACDEHQDGPSFIVHGVYILQNEELVCAHNYTVDIPSQQGTVELKLVAQPIRRIRKLSESDHISVDLVTDCSSEDAIVYDYLSIPSDGQILKEPRYIQVIRINAEENSGKSSRTMKFRMETSSGIPECADLSIRQVGR